MDFTLITGASGGIGLELARLCAADGRNLILVARSAGKLRAVKEELEGKYSIQVEVLTADLSRVDAAKELHEKTTAAGFTVDTLINNAGFGDHAAFLDSDWQRQFEMVQLNVTALMQLTHLYGNDMRRQGRGRILNLSSVAAFSAGPYMPIYYASKGFVLSFSLAVARELKGSGVTVTCLCPGPTGTGFEAAANMKGSKMFALRPQSAEAVARCGYDAMKRGKAIAYHSPTTKLFNIGSRLVSRSFAASLAEKINTKPERSN